MNETSLLQNKAADDSINLGVEPQRRLVKGRLRKWFLAIFALMILALTAFFFLRRGAYLPFSEPLSDPVSFLPLIRFEFREPGFFKEWKEHAFHKKTTYTVETVGNETVLHALSRGASSIVFKEFRVKLSERPFLSWEWKAVQFPSNKENKVLAAKQDNDFAARVYVAFRGRTPLSSDVIQYVWDDHFSEGTYRASPYSKKTRIFVIQSGKPSNSKDWVREKRDLVKDYQTLFKKVPRGDVIAVGVMSDSDNTGTESEAFYRRLSLEKPQL